MLDSIYSVIKGAHLMGKVSPDFRLWVVADRDTKIPLEISSNAIRIFREQDSFRQYFYESCQLLYGNSLPQESHLTST
jgi:hypothetical protein